MKTKYFSTEQIVALLREIEALATTGQSVAAICKQKGISEWTFYRWRKRFGTMQVDDAKRLKELEAENQRLKRLVAEQALDLQMLKEVARGKC